MDISFGVFDIFIMVGFLTSAMAFQMKCRRNLMRLRVGSTLAYMTYFYGGGAIAGAFGALISCLGALVQAVVPERLVKKTLYLRVGIAIFLACCGIAVFGTDSAAIYPMIGVIIARLAEVQSCVQRIRMGYLLSQSFWLYYSFEIGLLPFIMTETVLVASNLWAIWKHEQGRKQMLLISVKAA